ncbi:MAG: DUF882 domain-containing protein [Bacteroidales bacterium]|nr:DUF882 domain-containing protein [Bacteroidales bacterium]
MKITKNFTLTELTTTNTGITNQPNSQEVQALIRLCGKVLQPARDLYGAPIRVNSGFRSYAVNKAVGGARKSQHMLGQAADITVYTKENNKKLFELIRDNLSFDQLINERNYSWIHVSYKSEAENRNQILHL